MIVVETSALVAILLREDTAERLSRRIAEAEGAILPASCQVEAVLVLSRRQGPEAAEVVRWTIRELGLRVLAFTPAHAEAAGAAFLLFGKGRHPAALNFGDCMSYAVAKAEGLPLLYVGDDFARTDVARA